jgi:hypothetical protein
VRSVFAGCRAYSSRPSQHLCRSAEPSRARDNAYALEQDKVELGVDPAVEVPTGWRDASLVLQDPQMVWPNPEPSSRLRDMKIAVHAMSMEALL